MNEENQESPPPPAPEPEVAAPPPPPVPGAAGDASKKIPAGILGILLGALGIHKFFLGYNKEGVIMLAVSVVGGIVTCGIATSVVAVVGLVEGILYLTKPDDEFVQTYITGQKPWF